MIKRMCPYCGSENLREIEIAWYYHEINSWCGKCPEDTYIDETIDGGSDTDGLCCADCFKQFEYEELIMEEA